MTQALMTARFVLNELVLSVLSGQTLSTRSVELVGASSNSDHFPIITFVKASISSLLILYTLLNSRIFRAFLPCMAASVREALLKIQSFRESNSKLAHYQSQEVTEINR